MINIKSWLNNLASNPTLSNEVDEALNQLPFNIKEILFAEVFNELENETKSQGLWAMAFTFTEFEEGKAKSLYMKLRVLQLFDEYCIANKLVLLKEAEIEEQLRNNNEKSFQEEVKRKEQAAEISDNKKSKIAKMNKSGYTGLIEAARNNSIKDVKRLLELGIDPEIKNVDGKTAIDVAIYNGYTEIVVTINKFKSKNIT